MIRTYHSADALFGALMTARTFSGSHYAEQTRTPYLRSIEPLEAACRVVLEAHGGRCLSGPVLWSIDESGAIVSEVIKDVRFVRDFAPVEIDDAAVLEVA